MFKLAIGIGIGFALGSLGWARRSVEQRRAFDAVMRQNEMLRRREREIAAALLKVQSEAGEVKRVLELGDSVSLPPVAGNANRAAAKVKAQELSL